MFIREVKTKNKKTGKVYVKHVLMATRRTDKGPRQHTVMQLGQLSLSKEERGRLAKILEHRLAGQGTLFEIEDESLVSVADHAMENYRFLKARQKESEQRKEERDLVTIDTNSVRASIARSLGPELIGHEYWKRLGFDEVLMDCGLDPRQRSLAQAIVVGRLVKPGSELATWNWFRENTALPELLDEDISGISKNPFYEISDVLLPYKDKLEASLWENQQRLFNRKPTVFLYDLTNTYFEGLSKDNPLAQHGVSKEKRGDCRLVSLALVVDEQGAPVYSRIYRGNQGEPQTLEETLSEVYDENRLDGEHKPTIVMDRGIATSANIKRIKAKGLPYAVVERTKREKEYKDLLKECPTGFDCWQDSKGQKVYLKKLESSQDETRVLVKSSCRANKERAMDTLQQSRYINELEKILASLHRGNPKSTEQIERRIGKAGERFKTAAKHHKVSVSHKDGYATDITWSLKNTDEDRRDLEGAYVITTSHRNLNSNEIWELYITLTRVEGAFRDLKSDLGLRPVYHQKEDRVCAHLFISVLAYHLMSAIERDLKIKKIRDSWKTVCNRMSSMQRVTINYIDEDDQLHENRVSTVPEPHHQKIMDALRVVVQLSRRKAIVAKLT